jgi:ribosome-binding protein aMBF1 (putative translation factor)
MQHRAITLLERERRARAWSQRFLAGLLNVDSTTVVRWEHQQRFPKADTADKLERLFGISVDDLLSAS